jgi:hypothetical protein
MKSLQWAAAGAEEAEQMPLVAWHLLYLVGHSKSSV